MLNYFLMDHRAMHFACEYLQRDHDAFERTPAHKHGKTWVIDPGKLHAALNYGRTQAQNETVPGER